MFFLPVNDNESSPQKHDNTMRMYVEPEHYVFTEIRYHVYNINVANSEPN